MFLLPRTTWIVLLLACIGASWFAYQCLLVPHSARFSPHWEGAEWIQAGDAQAPVAYFRHTTSMSVVPDAAFVMVAATQVFRLYVNGVFIASNDVDFSRDSTPRTYIYDINALLVRGSDVIALRVANVDQQQPSVRVAIGLVRGRSISYAVSGPAWQATAQSTLVYPRYTTRADRWMTTGFTSYVWPPARIASNLLLSPTLMVNPLLYEQPVASRWMSAGAGHDAYYVRQFSFDASTAWLRLVAIGTASVFIDGRLLITWNGRAPVVRQSVASYLSDNEVAIPYRAGLALGIYDITPYLHPGINTVAVHVSNPGVSAAQVGLDNLQAALSLDILLDNLQGNTAWLVPTDAAWHTSSHAIDGWQDGTNGTLKWLPSIQVARPGTISMFYPPETLTPREAQVFPFFPICEIILFCCGGILGFWLLIALVVHKFYHSSYKAVLTALSVAYTPALACEALLIVLSREPLLPQPFPYTHLWEQALIGVVIASYVLLLLQARGTSSSNIVHLIKEKLRYRLHNYRIYPYLPSRIVTWFSRHWMILPLILVALPLSCYKLAYEPYWQDELSSYYAAYGVLKHGLPFFPSGFLYEKAELYSYILAFWMMLCGNSNERLISAIEYIISIPVFYFVGCYFFQRRIAFLATTMLALSPSVLLWARQVRMYEQAQLLTMLVMYLFYRAVREQRRPRFVYMAVFLLILDYLSHEEIFIILPALAICALVGSKDARYRLPSVLHRKHWWYAVAIGAVCIAVQLLLTRVTHPPVIGTDSSQRPLIQFSTDNIPFYLDMLFFQSVHGNLPWITMNSVLATIGCIWARYDSNRCAKYCALFLCISFFTLMLLFTMQADRYFYPLLPAYYLMGAYALLKMIDALRSITTFHGVLQNRKKDVSAVSRNCVAQQLWLVRWVEIITCICVLLGPMLPISNYNLFVSRIAGLSYHRHYPDYDAVGQYMQQHWHKGDIVISVAPDFCVFYYTGHVDYFFSIDRALFLFERESHIIDTSIGIQALLSQNDFDAVLAAHARVWIISDNAEYQAQVAKRFVFPPDFHIVFEGYGSAVYLRGDDG